MNEQQRIREIVRDYIVRHKEELELGTIGKKTLAKMVVMENPEMFDGDIAKAQENVRDIIRYLTKSRGDRSSKMR
jgi:hypothetical protein